MRYSGNTSLKHPTGEGRRIPLLQRNREYIIWQFSREEATGKYVLAIGREEKWNARDIARMPKIWWDVRIFMEQERSTYAITALLLLAGVKCLQHQAYFNTKDIR